MPVGLFAAAMGLVGLGAAARAAATLFPGVFRAPAYFTEFWIGLGILAFVSFLVRYAAKALRAAGEVRAELRNPLTLGACGTLPVATTLTAWGLAPYAPELARALWWTGCALLAALQAWGLFCVATRRVRLAEANPGWLVLFVGGIVVPGGGIALGERAAAQAFFAWSTLLAVPLLALLAWRALRGAPLPAALRPTWFIVLVPPSLIHAHGRSLFHMPVFDALFHAAWPTFLLLVLLAPRLLRAPFGPPWWSITFPLAAFAFAAARYAQAHPDGPWRALAGLAFVAATLAVTGVLLRSLQAWRLRLRAA